MAALDFRTLEETAEDVIAVMKTVPELASAKIAIIGGLALWKFLPRFRTTQDVDFDITTAGAPKAVKSKLLALPNSPFQQVADNFMYNAKRIPVQIDMVPDWQLPYLPSNAVTLSAIQPGALPYISIKDLIYFKILSCGLRPTALKKTQDATDARALLEFAAANAPAQFMEEQKQQIALVLEDIVQNTPVEYDEAWWKAKLSLK